MEFSRCTRVLPPESPIGGCDDSPQPRRLGSLKTQQRSRLEVDVVLGDLAT
jgi:hypothetical protein